MCGTGRDLVPHCHMRYEIMVVIYDQRETHCRGSACV